MPASIRDVDVGHYQAFTTALANILRTIIAEHTYAEIIGGIPTAQTWYESIPKRHDTIEAHRELCPGTLEAARRFQAGFRSENLVLDGSVRMLGTLLPAILADSLVRVDRCYEHSETRHQDQGSLGCG